MPGLVTVAAYDDLSFAYMAKARLESEGIPCFLANEHLVGVQWLYSNAVGGIKVQVPEAVAEEALALLTGDLDDAGLFPGPDAPEDDTESFADDGRSDDVPDVSPAASISPATSPATSSGAASGASAALSEECDERIGDGVFSCPACGSSDIERRDYGKAFAAFGFLSGLPLPLRFRRSRCGQCGHTWK